MGHGAPDEPAAAKPLWVPPRRGRVRKRYVALLIILLLVGWVGWKVYSAATAKPGPFVDYGQQLIDISGSLQPEGENGWSPLIEAIRRAGEVDPTTLPEWPRDTQASADALSLYRVLRGVYEPSELRSELAYLGLFNESGALEFLDESARCPRCVRESYVCNDTIGLIGRLAPEYGPVRVVLRLRLASLRIAAATHDTTEFERAWSHLMCLCRGMSYDPCLLGYLLGSAVVQDSCKELNCILTESELDRETTRKLLALMDARPLVPDAEFLISAERLEKLDLVQHVFSDTGNGDGILIADRLATYCDVTGPFGIDLTERPLLNLPGSLMPRRAETTRMFEEYYAKMLERAKMSAEMRRSQPFDFDAYMRAGPVRSAPVRASLVDFSSILGTRDLSETDIAATRLLLAIEMYVNQHGEPPAALADLVPEFIDSVPGDAISCQPFGYVRRDPTPDDLRPFWLYSYGVDGEDNGGLEPEGSRATNRYALRDLHEGRGFDCIFNRLREPVEPDEDGR